VRSVEWKIAGLAPDIGFEFPDRFEKNFDRPDFPAGRSSSTR
jgi:hypothetical protein